MVAKKFGSCPRAWHVYCWSTGHQQWSFITAHILMFLWVLACDTNYQNSNPTPQTKDGIVNGYLWGRWPRETITYFFNAKLPLHGRCIINPPYVDVEDTFFLPSASQPEVFDTLIRVAGHTLLVSSYFDSHLGPNPNLKRDFPSIPWCGEIAVLFVGKRKPFVRRAPPDLVVCSAITQWVCIIVSWDSNSHL